MTAERRGAWRVALVLFAVGWGANHFASLLPVYRRELALDATAPALLFGMYALGLVPGLLLAGPLSDRRGRRALVVPAAIAALLASLVLGALGHSFAALLGGRLLYGLAAGAVMSPGAVWLLELSSDTGPGVGARRATIALSAGFGLGPLITGVLAQYAPSPTVLPYVAHIAALALALIAVRAAPDSGPRTGGRGPLLRFDLDRTAWTRFARQVVPMAPFVFAFPTIAFAALPNALGGSLGTAYIGLLCAVTLGSGVIAQPVTRRLSPSVGARLGLVVGAAGIGLGALAAFGDVPELLLVTAPLLGAAYGVCMTSGLRAVEALAPAHARGGLIGLYYVLTYVGFAAPYLLALAMRVVAAPLALGATAAIVVLAAALLSFRADPGPAG